MADWDEDSLKLRANLSRVSNDIKTLASSRASLKADCALVWHVTIMDGLTVDKPNYVGNFRGPPKLIGIRVCIGTHICVEPEDVATQLARFEKALNARLKSLDVQIPKGVHPENVNNGIQNVLSLCAWVHAEWIRIHPFANGNGRTARLWANLIAMRYEILPFVTLRPRPQGDYATAAQAAMVGNWVPTLKVFWKMFMTELKK